MWAVYKTTIDGGGQFSIHDLYIIVNHKKMLIIHGGNKVLQ